MVREVNYWYIWAALGYLEIAEAELGQPLHINPEDDASLMEAFSKFVKPHVLRWPKDCRNTLRLSLAFFINNKNVLEYNVLANMPNLTMSDPANTVQFFQCLWQVLYPNEYIESVEIRDVTINNDIMQVNSTLNRK